MLGTGGHLDDTVLKTRVKTQFLSEFSRAIAELADVISPPAKRTMSQQLTLHLPLGNCSISSFC